jgi:predicted enzyme related to lactoylglutathione lyase
MSERESYEHGTPSWADHSSSDPEAAASFYSGIFGWETENVMPPDAGGQYFMARVRGRDVAALSSQMSPGPVVWTTYITVDDADATAAKVQDAGGRVLAEPFDVFDSGRMAILQDSQGAILSLWQPRAHIGAGLVNAPGALSWNDLVTPDVEASAAFYRDLFGWTIEETPGSDGRYWTITNEGRLNGGLLPMIPEGHPAWNLYFAVEDCDAAVARAGELGGGTIMGPMELPNGSSFAILRDPQNAVFSVLSGPLDP